MPDDETPLEAPTADVVEQAAEADPPARDGVPAEVPLDADPADVAEQAREVPAAEDEYR